MLPFDNNDLKDYLLKHIELIIKRGKLRITISLIFCFCYWYLSDRWNHFVDGKFRIFSRRKWWVTRNRVSHGISDDISQCYHKIANRQENYWSFRVAESPNVQQKSQYLQPLNDSIVSQIEPVYKTYEDSTYVMHKYEKYISEHQ